jgi:DNA-binding NtrC family response regulator
MAIANLLLVDDEKPFVEAIVRRLTKRDVNVIVAFSGQEALEKLEEGNNIEVVVLDVKMPEIDGIETLRLIKNKYPLVEVMMKLGAFDYLMKPCDIEQLIHQVKKAAERKRRHEDKILEAFSKPYRPKDDMDKVVSQVKEEVAKKLAE